MNYGLTVDTTNKITALFKQFPEIEDVILYGSRAKGNYKASSDIDIVLKGKNVNLFTLSKISLLIDDLLLPYQFDISIYHHITNTDLLMHITRAGKSLLKNQADLITDL